MLSGSKSQLRPCTNTYFSTRFFISLSLLSLLIGSVIVASKSLKSSAKWFPLLTSRGFRFKILTYLLSSPLPFVSQNRKKKYRFKRSRKRFSTAGGIRILIYSRSCYFGGDLLKSDSQLFYNSEVIASFPRGDVHGQAGSQFRIKRLTMMLKRC